MEQESLARHQRNRFFRVICRVQLALIGATGTKRHLQIGRSGAYVVQMGLTFCLLWLFLELCGICNTIVGICIIFCMFCHA